MDDEARVSGHTGKLAAEVLSARGVDAVFTLSGGHIFPLFDGCMDKNIRLVDVRHEQTAVFAAEAVAKVSRQVGVASLTAGPGVTNGVSAMTSAFFGGSPVCVIGGRAPQARWGQGSLQEIDHLPIVSSVTKAARTAQSPEGAAADLHQLLIESDSPHRGPTFLDVPMDTFFSSSEIALPGFGTPEILEPDPEGVARAAELLSKARRPVLIAGSDVYWERAEGALQELAETANLPVFMNGMGRGLMSADHRLVFSRARSAGFKLADLVLVVGTPLDFRLGFGNFGDAAVVHLMDTPERVSANPLAAGVGGDLRAILGGLARRFVGTPDPAWVESLRDVENGKRAADEDLLNADQDPIHPARIFGELRQRLDPSDIVIGDGGDFVSYAGRFIDSSRPGSFLEPGPFGCLGTGPGYTLGAHTAAPDRRIFLLWGDGAAGFSLGDLETLVRFNVPFVGIIGNNGCWGLEKHPMKQLYGYYVAADLSPDCRFDEIMETLGGHGEQVTETREIGPAIDRAIASEGPAIVNVMTDPENAYPRSTNLG